MRFRDVVELGADAFDRNAIGRLPCQPSKSLEETGALFREYLIGHAALRLSISAKSGSNAGARSSFVQVG